MNKAGARRTGMVIELGDECAEFAQLEQITQVNLRGVAYGW